MQLLNEFPHILETFEGMIISIIFDPENANSLIVCKLEFGWISILVKFLQL